MEEPGSNRVCVLGLSVDSRSHGPMTRLPSSSAWGLREVESSGNEESVLTLRPQYGVAENAGTNVQHGTSEE